jgi:hypothetical protein
MTSTNQSHSHRRSNEVVVEGEVAGANERASLFQPVVLGCWRVLRCGGQSVDTSDMTYLREYLFGKSTLQSARSSDGGADGGRHTHGN